MVGNGNFLQSKGLINSVPLHIQGHVVKFPAYALPILSADIILGAVWPTDAIAEAYTIQCFAISTYTSRCIQHSDIIPLDLAAVLSKFSSVFELPIGYPVSQKTEIEKMVNEMFKEGLIQPSNSPFSAPVLLFHKKDVAVLRLPDFIVETDASGYGVGAILSQDGHPITFFSKKFSSKMQQASTYVRELYAINKAIAKFRHCLFGHYFIICTEHRSLRHLTNQTLHTLEQEAFLPKLLGYNFTVEYKAGNSNLAANELSRSLHMKVSTSQSSMLSDIRDSLASLPYVSSLLHQIEKDPDGILPYFLFFLL
ncbi:ty3-gypsy retrotransposon protein [Tanacetum coccineum]